MAPDIFSPEVRYHFGTEAFVHLTFFFFLEIPDQIDELAGAEYNGFSDFVRVLAKAARFGEFFIM